VLGIKNWKRLLLWLLVIIPGVPFVVGITGYLFYVFWPQSYGHLESLELREDVANLIVISHGLGDNSKSWGDELGLILESQRSDAQIISLDWNPWSKKGARLSEPSSTVLPPQQRMISFIVSKQPALFTNN